MGNRESALKSRHGPCNNNLTITFTYIKMWELNDSRYTPIAYKNVGFYELVMKKVTRTGIDAGVNQPQGTYRQRHQEFT